MNVIESMVEQTVASGKISLGGCILNLTHLEMIVRVLAVRQDIQITNCGGTISLIEIGAYLAGMGKA